MIAVQIAKFKTTIENLTRRKAVLNGASRLKIIEPGKKKVTCKSRTRLSSTPATMSATAPQNDQPTCFRNEIDTSTDYTGGLPETVAL